MRLKFPLSATLLPLALLVSGCGTGLISGNDADVASVAVAGKSYGGQSPIVGATINIYAAGNAGYGSTATLLASTTTDSSGNFSFPAGAYTCPSPNAPVYILSIGGNTGAGTNSSAVNGVGIGACSQAPSTYVVMNEVTTVALAFSLSHFFTTSLGPTSTDSFGGPPVTSVQYSPGITNAMFYQIRNMVNINYGGVNAPTNGTIDSAKIYTLANILAACVNTTGPANATETRTVCGKLFKDTTVTGGSRPTDTLQAAVEMALNPLSNVAALFALTPSTPAFANGLTAAPNDWTIGISFTAPNLGLSVDSASVSTIDIDSQGRIWFPTNKIGAVGAAYFDPADQGFFGPYNNTAMVHPEQVAIDGNAGVENAWYNDTQSGVVSSYDTAAPSTYSSFSLPLTFTTSVTINDDDSVALGLEQYSNGNSAVSKVSADRTAYTLQSNTTSNYPYASIVGDPNGGDALLAENLPGTRLIGSYLSPQGAVTSVLAGNDNTGQVIFTGNDFVSVRSYAGSGNANDGLCIFSQQVCFGMKGALQISPIGLAIDGTGTLWLADSAGTSVQAVYPQTTGAGNATVYLNLNNVVPSNRYLHGPNDGGTMVTPYGIAVDNSGNVWVSNAGCTTTTCAPGSFVLSEIVGAAAPTVTPVSAQILGNTTLTGTEPQ